MKYLLLLLVGITLASCGTKVPYTNEIRDEFGLEEPKAMAKVQFFTSATIVLERSKESGNQGTTEGGVLVSNSSSEKDRIIIPIGTKCIFEKYDENGNIVVRFEPGVGNAISFGQRSGQSTSGKFYFLADWTKQQGGEVMYGNNTYYATTASGSAYLQVVRKKLQKSKRRDRVVKGMKV